jgi:hypothetical protein
MPYNHGQIAFALEIAKRSNNELTSRTMEDIRAALDAPKLPRSTVWRWLKGLTEAPHDPQPKKPSSKSPVSASARQPQKREKKRSDAAELLALQPEAAQKLDEQLELAAQRFVQHALRQEVVSSMNGQQAMTAAGIAIDKMRLLRGLPTEIVQIMPNLLERIRQRGLDAVGVFQAMYAELGAN